MSLDTEARKSHEAEGSVTPGGQLKWGLHKCRCPSPSTPLCHLVIVSPTTNSPRLSDHENRWLLEMAKRQTPIRNTIKSDIEIYYWWHRKPLRGLSSQTHCKGQTQVGLRQLLFLCGKRLLWPVFLNSWWAISNVWRLHLSSSKKQTARQRLELCKSLTSSLPLHHWEAKL